MYNAIDVANYIVNKSIDMGAPVSNLKLQKLLYYVQAAKLVEDGKEMFGDPISAWKYGPVVESVYHKFKIYANAQIGEKIVSKDADYINEFDNDEEYNPYDVINKKDQIIIDRVLNAHREHDAMYLVRKTHSEAPWIEAREKKETYILSDAIKAYYELHGNSIYS